MEPTLRRRADPRYVKGLRDLDRREPYPNDGTWLWVREAQELALVRCELIEINA